MAIDLPGYYNRFNEQWRYEDILFRAGLGLQSAELNEVQALQFSRLRRIADVLFADGEVVRGEPPAIDSNTGAITCGEAVVYITGTMREVPERSFVIPIVGVVQVGVYLLQEVVTEDDTNPGAGEPSLRDPALGTRNYNEPGAARLRETPTWGHDGEGFDGVFWPVWTVVDGVLQGQAQPDGNPFIDLLARYDRESNGNYIVDGLSVTAIGAGLFSVREGTGNIFGYKVDKGNTSRLTFPVDPELEAVTSEPDVYVNGTTDIQLNRRPVQAIQEVVVTLEKTISITRGGASGGSDLLPDVSVVSVELVVQGGTTYTSPADYVLNGDAVDWSPGGAEPSPGSTYSITYRYLANVTPSSVDLDAGTFRVTGAVAGSLVLTDYDWKLPRYDRICLGRDGSFSRVKGISSRYRPLPPAVPADLLSLATVTQGWIGAPSVSNDGIRAIKFNEIERMRSLVLDLFDLVAQERLLRDIAAREPTTKRGVFVDPFRDDDMRDAGRPQDAAVVSGSLMLPIKAEPFLLPSANNGQDWMLPYNEEPILQQLLETGSEKINPYANFNPAPAVVRISPASDRWVVTEQVDAIDQDTERMRFIRLDGNNVDPLGLGRNLWSTQDQAEFFAGRTLSRTELRFLLGGGILRDAVEQDTTANRPESTDVVRTLREITIQFDGSLFAPGEVITAVQFAGVTVPTTPSTITANGSGVITGSFQIPAGVPTGRHPVTFTGSGGSFAEASFFGEVTVERTFVQQQPIDPLAQTFTLDQGRYITSVDLGFRVIGSTSNHVTVEIREVDLGLPTSIVVASGVVAGGDLNATGWTNVLLERPVYLPAGREFALVLLTDDSTHAVAIAQLGKFDATAQQWVTAQPYTVGTLLKSSNASTWTPFQEADLTFRLNGAAFTSNTRTVDLGPVFRVAASSITRSSTTATVTATGHGLTTGQTAVISGADQAEYNIAAIVTVIDANTFTYTVAGSPVTPATGTLVVAPGLTSEIAVLATVERPTGACSLEFVISKENGGSEIRTTDNGYVELTERIVSGLRLSAVLTGNAIESPFLFRDTMVILGNLQESATYISRAIPSAVSAKVLTTFDQIIPASSTVTVELEKSDLGWLAVAQDSTTELGDGWLEATHAEETFATSGIETRVRLSLTGTPASRPYIQNLRVVTV